MNDKDKPQFDAAAQEELNGVPEEFLDDGEADKAQKETQNMIRKW